MNRLFSNHSTEHKPPDHDINTLREQAVKIATEEALISNVQGPSFLALARAELRLRAKGDAPPIAELEKQLGKLTGALEKSPTPEPVSGGNWAVRLVRLWKGFLKYRQKRARDLEIRHLEDQIASARNAQARQEEWLAERMAVIINQYQLQLRRAQAAVKVTARSGNGPAVSPQASAGDKQIDERKQSHEIRIAAAS